MVTLIPGDIIIVNNRDGNILSKLIRFFTGGWSHTAIAFFPIPNKSYLEQTIFESNLTTGITEWAKTYDHRDYDLRIYRWIKDVGMEKVLWSFFHDYNGNTYGWFQLLWFVWRWLVEKLHLPKRWARKNFFPNLEICTEVIYVAFERTKNPQIMEVLKRLNKNQNTVHPGDIVFICEELREMGLLDVNYNRER